MLTTHLGAWQGTNKLWLHPGADPKESKTALRVFAHSDSGACRIEYTWSSDGTPHSGDMEFRRDDDGGVTMDWNDTFHTPGGAMACSGTEEDGKIDVLGHYGAGGGEWGWRTVIDTTQPDRLTVTMFNITPAGEEAPAVEFTLTRAQ